MAYIRAKKRGNKTYYYLVEGKREGKKVKQKVIQYLGPSKDLKIRKEQAAANDITVHSSLDYGSIVALHTLAERIGLSKAIYNATTKGGGQHIGKLIEIMVLNRCIEPLSRNRLKGWYEKTALPILLGIPPGKAHPQIFYNAMNYLTDKAILRIQKELYENVKRIYGVDTSTVFYDLTSTYFEGTKCPLSELGYTSKSETFGVHQIHPEFGSSTDHRPDKLQINIGTAVDIDCIQITHEVFNGSVKDVTTVQNFAEKLKSEFGIESPIAVIDRGMIFQENLTQLERLQYHYIVARKMGASETKIVCKIPDEEFTKEVLTNYSEEREVFLMEKCIDGKRWIICWNKKKAEDDKAFRDIMIARSARELEKVRNGCGKRNLKTKEQVYHAAYTIVEKHGTKRFFEMDINMRGAPRLKFQLKDGEIEKACRLDGKYILETSNHDMKDIEIAQAYLNRDVIEKFFQSLKNIVELGPVYVYTEQHVKAHVFICTLAVLLLSLLRKTLKEAGKDITSIKALDILDSIKRVEFSLIGRKEIIVRTTQFTDQQREIVSIISVAPIGL